MLFVIFHMTQANEQCSLYNTQVVGYNSYVLHSYTDTGGPAYIWLTGPDETSIKKKKNFSKLL